MVEEPATALVEVVMWNGINQVSAGNSKDSVPNFLKEIQFEGVDLD